MCPLRADNKLIKCHSLIDTKATNTPPFSAIATKNNIGVINVWGKIYID
jgi:hypothetical protein